MCFLVLLIQCVINDGVDDTKHYLLSCHLYDAHRHDLLNSVNALFHQTFHDFGELPLPSLLADSLFPVFFLL